jgi:hypothetical protein
MITIADPQRRIPHTHACPGGCGNQDVSAHQLTCRRCWYRVPVELRDDVWRTFRARRASFASMRAHAEAILAARTWFRDNPLP